MTLDEKNRGNFFFACIDEAQQKWACECFIVSNRSKLIIQKKNPKTWLKQKKEKKEQKNGVRNLNHVAKENRDF